MIEENKKFNIYNILRSILPIYLIIIIANKFHIINLILLYKLILIWFNMKYLNYNIYLKAVKAINIFIYIFRKLYLLR